MTTQFRIELPDDQATQLQGLASLRATTPEALLAEAAQVLLADAAAFDAWAAEGIADEEAGRTVSWQEAMAEVDSIIARARAARG